MESYYLAWWNVENLFDTSTSKLRPDWLRSRLKSELKGWTSTVLDKKIKNLASVIRSMNDDKGPDLIGLCEVENELVLKKLTDQIGLQHRNYAVAYHDSQDQRGVDIAFIYDRNAFNWDGTIFNHVVLKRNATRDLLQVNLTTKNGSELIVIGNHWPARLGGKELSEPYRCIAGETLSYWIKRIQEIKGSKIPILVMGDFNDEPGDRSLVDHALSTRNRTRVVYARNPMLHNLSWEAWAKNDTTYSYGSEHLMIDQMLVSKGLCYKQGVLRTAPEMLEIFRMDGMTSGRYNVPVRFGRPSSHFNESGFSDHLPLTLRITEH